MGLSRKSSLRSSATIGKVVGMGQTFARGELKLHVLSAEAGSRNLFAFAVSRHGHSIAARNRLRRRLQEIVRTVPLSSHGLLAVLRCSPAAYDRSYGELKESYSRLVGRNPAK